MPAALQAVYFLFSKSSSLSVREMQLCADLQEGIVDPQLSSLYMGRKSAVYICESQTNSEMMLGGFARS